MSIRFSCPNGHLLHAPESFAGRTGRCPACKAVLKVPSLHAENVEEQVLGIIGQYDPGRYKNPAAVQVSELSGTGSAVQTPPAATPTPAATHYKTCNRCHREIAVGTHVCPYCRTYIAGLSDF